jgi:hypothetical protein
MSFNWPKFYKEEQRLENIVGALVFEQVSEFYGVEDLSQLTKDQLEEVLVWADDELPPFSLLAEGFKNLRDTWEYTNEFLD